MTQFADIYSGINPQGADIMNDFLLFNENCTPAFIMEPTEYTGVKKVLRKFFDDFEAVFGVKPTVNEASKATLTGGYSLYLKNNPVPNLVVIVGTVGKCTIFETLESVNIFDSSLLHGKRECYSIIPVENLSFGAYPGIRRLLIVAGSDLMGTLYGLFKLSELIGVTPWSNYMGYSPVKRSSLSLPGGMLPIYSNEPSVHFRGFCLNSENETAEEAAALHNLPKLDLYFKLFELLLRLKGNYMWPLDDFSPATDEADAFIAKTASEFGITLGNPFGRPGIVPDEQTDDKEKGTLLRKIGGFRSRLHRPTDDVLMLSDDNYGHIGLLPAFDLSVTDKRFGMYYHLAYNGRPAAYGWPNRTHPSKIWTQMTTAYEYGVREIWVANVGSISGVELPLSYFMDLAYDYLRYGSSNPGNVENYTRDFAAAQFPLLSRHKTKSGQSFTDLAADVMLDCACLNGRQHPNLSTPLHFPVIPDRKRPELPVVGSILEFADDLEARAKTLQFSTPEPESTSFFTLVTKPVLYSVGIHKIRLFKALSDYYSATDARISELFSRLSESAKRLFSSDPTAADTAHYPVNPSDYYYPDNKEFADEVSVIFPDDFIENEAAGDTEWLVLSPYGYNVSALCITPFYAHFEIPGTGPVASYILNATKKAFYTLRFQFAPTNSISATSNLRFAYSIGDGDPVCVDTLPDNYRAGDPESESWVTDAMFNFRCVDVFVDLTPGENLLSVYAMDSGVILEGIYLIEKK